ncbi:hypothetical protein CRUP_035813 [Coryphaenoides rupestris]|nr:hypothetical protein CRUP_035813 [Coryphaenoides rupestris]
MFSTGRRGESRRNHRCRSRSLSLSTGVRSWAPPRLKGTVEGLCVSTVLGVVRSHAWLAGEQSVPPQAHARRRRRRQKSHRESGPELGPPPSVDEAANTLMTRLGFLLGDKVSEGPAGTQYSMEEPEDRQGHNQRISPCSTLTSSTASPPAGSPCSTLPPSMPATLTSYSENVERCGGGGGGGGKYGDGCRGNMKLWQPQKSGMDSLLYRVDENMTASTYSLNKIPERSLESMSSHSAHSIPLYLMPRPNSVAATSSAHLEDLAYLDEQRHTPLRTSLRMPRQSTTCGGAGRSGPDLRVRFAPYRPQDIALKPLLFEVPSITMDSVFTGRDWLFQEIDGQLNGGGGGGSSGVVVVGSIGFGKTAIVVAYHYCQADNAYTCLVPEFVHNVAALLCRSPHLVAYREQLLREPHLQSMLSLRSCVQDPLASFRRGVLEPLDALYKGVMKVSPPTEILTSCESTPPTHTPPPPPPPST